MMFEPFFKVLILKLVVFLSTIFILLFVNDGPKLKLAALRGVQIVIITRFVQRKTANIFITSSAVGCLFPS